jgi:4-hydroxy-3-polyprenylbenzoate decarboxylase
MAWGHTENPKYPDLHAHIAALERNGLLFRVQRPINKDTEMHALVRWQFRGGIAESQRKGFLFENVIDSTGRRYDIPRRCRWRSCLGRRRRSPSQAAEAP